MPVWIPLKVLYRSPYGLDPCEDPVKIPVGILYGSFVDPYMDQIRILYGSQYGSYLDPIWTLYGSSMQPCMNHMWILVSSMDGTYESHDMDHTIRIIEYGSYDRDHMI